MLKFTPFALILLVLAGCGSTPTAKPTPAPVTPKPTTPTVHAAGVVFGTGFTGKVLHGRATSFTKPKSLAWIASWSKGAGTPTKIIVTRLNGPGTHPRLAWSGPVSVAQGATKVTGQMTAAQMKARAIVSLGDYSLSYASSHGSIATGDFDILGPNGGPGSSY